MDAHAKFSASASERWLACPGSIALSAGLPNETSDYAAEGTLAHRLFESALLAKYEPTRPEARLAQDWLGEVHEVEGYVFTVEQDMVDAVNAAIAAVVNVASEPDLIQAERVFHYAAWLNVALDAAFGTSDCTVLVGDELQVHDFKYGKGVHVDAVDNSQLMLYAGGALLEHAALADVKTVRMFIHQPRVRDEPSEWAVPVEELHAWLKGRARSGAASVIVAESELRKAGVDTKEWEDTFLTPGDHCRWCPAKRNCNARRNAAFTDVYEIAPASPDDFDDLTLAPRALPSVQATPPAWVAAVLPRLEEIETWCKDVRAYALALAEKGELPGYKVVQGKRGNRAWADKDQAENLLRKVFRLKVESAYNLELVSPAQAEKLVKAGTISPRQWKKAQALIVQSEGKPHLAPANDPRPALRAALSDFDAAPAAGDIC